MPITIDRNQTKIQRMLRWLPHRFKIIWFQLTGGLKKQITSKDIQKAMRDLRNFDFEKGYPGYINHFHWGWIELDKLRRPIKIGLSKKYFNRLQEELDWFKDYSQENVSKDCKVETLMGVKVVVAKKEDD